MDRIVPGYSRGRVNRAGWALARTDSTAPKVREDLRVLNNWRTAHSFPLNELHHRLRTLAAPIGSDTIISQRLKTTPSTLAKLRRFPRMQLARMQDMGGCRAALDTVAQVRELHEVHRRAGWEHRLVRDVDYIDRPKPSGYRGVHLVYRYRGDGNSPFNGILIEDPAAHEAAARLGDRRRDRRRLPATRPQVQRRRSGMAALLRSRQLGAGSQGRLPDRPGHSRQLEGSSTGSFASTPRA